MEIIQLDQNKIGEFIKNHILDSNVVFVFPTEYDKDSWAEWCILHPELSGVESVFMSQFIDWDTFKEKYLILKDSDRKPISSIMRKAFCYNLLNRNSKEPFLSSIVSPEYKEDGRFFAEWLSKNLISLKEWFERYEQALQNGYIPNEEDKDYELIYKEYLSFLGSNFYEKSWEINKIGTDEFIYIIFYPCIISDFQTYEEVLKQKNITIVDLPNNFINASVYKFSSSRQEIRRISLYIRDIVNNHNTSYGDIAVHIPDYKNYESYLLREFDKYCIPYNVVSPTNILDNSFATVFEQIKKAKENNMSFETVRELLLNNYIPWKNYELNEQLIRKACELHIICNYDYRDENDQWILAFNNSENYKKYAEEYLKLKKSVFNIYNSSSFSMLRENLIDFFDSRININEVRDYLDLINEKIEKGSSLSQDEEILYNKLNKFDVIYNVCISTLSKLVSEEKSYIKPLELKIDNHFCFFMNELQTKGIVKKIVTDGVKIFNYGTCACGAYKHNIVINCNQSSMSLDNRRLSFLTNLKREMLGVTDTDISSSTTCRLYNKKSVKDGSILFTFSEDTFSGFAIPYNLLNEVSMEKGRTPFDYLDENDFIIKEKKMFLLGTDIRFLSENQIREFNTWKEISDFIINPEVNDKADVILHETTENFLKKRDKPSNSIPYITQSDMENFFPCSKKWLLSKVLKIEEDTLSTTLFDSFTQGNINHKILELLLKKYSILPISDADGIFSDTDDELLKDNISKCADLAINDKSFKFKESPIAFEVLSSQKSTFEGIIYAFMKEFCKINPSKGFGGYKTFGNEYCLDSKDSDKAYGLYGKLDCILSDAEGNITIIDFKNTEAHCPSVKTSCYDEVKKTLNNFQCAMYVTLWNKNNNTKVSKMVFKPIKKPDSFKFIINDKPDKRSKSCTLEDYSDNLRIFNEYTDMFYTKILKADFEPSKDSECSFDKVDSYDHCSDCKFKTICRTTYTVAGHKL